MAVNKINLKTILQKVFKYFITTSIVWSNETQLWVITTPHILFILHSVGFFVNYTHMLFYSGLFYTLFHHPRRNAHPGRSLF